MHTLNLSYAHRPRSLRPGRPCRDRVMACRVPYRRPRTSRVAGPLGRIMAVSLRACRVTAMSLPYRWACRDTPQQPSLRLSRYNRLYRYTLPSGQASLSCHDTKLCIATLGRIAALPWSYRGSSWLCRGPPLHIPARPS